MPDEVGKDFNDVLREKGIKGVMLQMKKLYIYESNNIPQKREFLSQGKKRVKKFENQLEPDLWKTGLYQFT